MADGYPNEIPLIADWHKASSMQHALATGFISTYSLERDKDKGVKIDLATDTPGKRAIDGMIARSIAEINASPALMKLLAKPEWTRVDRQQWEASIANISSNEMYEEPRYGSYRLDRKKPMTPISITEITKDTNFHCEPMAVMSGILVQTLENHYLQPSEDKTQLKRRTDYYLTGGIVYRSAYQTGKKPVDVAREASNGETLHAFIVSPVTGNYIEGTIGRANGWNGSAASVYRTNAIKGHTFEDYIAGFPMIADNAGFTMGYDGSLTAQAMANKRKEALRSGDDAALVRERISVEKGLELNPLKFADERNIARDMAPVLEGEEAALYSLSYIDRVERISDVVAGAFKTGRPYKQLLQDARRVDFAVTLDELKALSLGNRLLYWAKEKPFAERMIRDKKSLSHQSDWSEAALVEYLDTHGVSDVWVHRVISKDAVPTGNNFEQVVKAYYDALPPERLSAPEEKEQSVAAGPTQKSEKKENPKIQFSEYLALVKQQYTSAGGKPETINAPGTVVPLLANPLHQWEISKQLKGRTFEVYQQEDVIAANYTQARITNHPGTNKDDVLIQGYSVINGNGARYYENIPVGITESAGELPSPKTPPVVKAKPPQRVHP